MLISVGIIYLESIIWRNNYFYKKIMNRTFIVFGFLFIVFVLFSSCSGEHEQNTELKYISFNVRNSRANDGENSWENRRPAVKDMIERESPDVMGLQEAYIEQLEYIDSNFPGYSRVGVGRDDGKEDGEFMALYYRNDKYQLLDNGDFWLSETPDIPDFGWDAGCKRIVTLAKLQDKETKKVFYAFNTHLDNVGEIARKQSILLIVDRINKMVKKKNMPVFLSGDFNSNADMPIFDPLKEIMGDSRKILPKSEWKKTFNNYGVDCGCDTLIDHIFYRNAQAIDFNVLDGDYGRPYISDHYPVAAKFRF